ncbi:MAG: PKD domain-containing protein [Acidobacteriota bacterium]|nr:PKD domain-containing protein [Acidobacteriota bacterium]
MNLRPRRIAFSLLAAAVLFFLGARTPLRAATYLPLSDADLAEKSPVIVRAQVLSQQVVHRAVTADGAEALFTVTTLRVLESLKGSDLLPGDSFSLELPGGEEGPTAYWVAGTPQFASGGEAVLFLSRHREGSGDFALTEFGLSKFDLLNDRSGRTFAVRPVFSDDEDDAASQRRPIRIASAGETRARALRDGGSFLAMLRAVAAGAVSPVVLYLAPDGELRSGADPAGKRPLWVNIGGVEGSGNQFRWYWDTGLSPNAIVSANGTQTGLSDGSNGVSAVQNAAAQWSAVSGATVRYSSSSGSAPVVVNLDVVSQSPAWTDPLSCGTGGVIGYGGPGSSRSAPAFKGQGGFFAPASGNVWMRKVTGGCYSAATFRAAVLHEVGHTLGLGHSDDAPSAHSTTTSVDRSSAVMHSVIPSSKPSTPQADDIQAIQYYYGSGSAPTPTPTPSPTPTPTSPPSPAVPRAAFSFSPTNPATGAAVQFTDGSSDSPTDWAWTFGDPLSGGANFSVLRNPSHSYASPGTYTVSLSVANNAGSTTTSQTVTVSGCGANALCLNGGRFRVQASWRVPSQGTSGVGAPIALTGDTGYFWFFTNNNVELVVKVVDGTPLNGRFWFFSGALSDVEYTVQVTDTRTGAVRTYFNPQGSLASTADTSAFAAGEMEPSRFELPGAGGGDPGAGPVVVSTPGAAAADGPCFATPTALCLNASRFRVEVSWQVPAQGTRGSGIAVPLTSDTGHFWFFSVNNVELVVKVVDGRAFNGHFWVFSGALSDVGYTITVTDTATGAVRSYSNTSGSLASLSDVSAF